MARHEAYIVIAKQQFSENNELANAKNAMLVLNHFL